MNHRLHLRLLPLAALVWGCAAPPAFDDSACATTDNGDGTYTLACPGADPVTILGEGWTPEPVDVGNPFEPPERDPQVLAGDVYVSNTLQLQYLRGVREITGDVVIQMDSGIDLEPLSDLEVVGGSFEIRYSHWMEDLTGLSSLHTVGGRFSVRSMSGLTSLQGIDALAHVGQEVRLQDLPLLSDAGDLSGVDWGATGLSIVRLDALDELAFLAGVTTSASVQLTDLPSLEDLSDLSSLSQVDGQLTLYGLDLITDLSDLQALTSVQGWLRVEHNTLLDDIDALYGLEALHDAVRVRNNPSLCADDVLDWYESYDVVHENDLISGNNGPC